jgi:hypothetical protein
LNDQDDLTESSPATSETQTGQQQQQQQQQQQFSSPSPPSLGSIIGMLKNAYSTDTQSPTLPAWSTTTAHPTLATQLPVRESPLLERFIFKNLNLSLHKISIRIQNDSFFYVSQREEITQCGY